MTDEEIAIHRAIDMVEKFAVNNNIEVHGTLAVISDLENLDPTINIRHICTPRKPLD